MKWPWSQKANVAGGSVLQRLIAQVYGTVSDITPENCLKSPTMRSIVSGISGRIACYPLHVYQTGESNGRETMEKLPNHPVAKLLKNPNETQSAYDYWQDAVSSYLRKGYFLAVKGQGSTGPIRRLYPVNTGHLDIKEQGSNYIFKTGENEEYPFNKLHYVRGPSNDFIRPQSIVENMRITIGVEVAAEEYGWSFFENGAMPLMIWKMVGAFKTPEDQKKFIEDFQNAYSGRKRFRSMIPPKGIEFDQEVNVDNEKTQFIQTKKQQAIQIAAGYGIPPHVVGILDNAHYNNIEQQEQDLINTVLRPIMENFERAMERDLLTDNDRKAGIKIRFNLNAILRADIETQMKVIEAMIRNSMATPNDGLEHLNMNPISEKDGGNKYYISTNYLPVTTDGANNANDNPNPPGNQSF